MLKGKKTRLIAVTLTATLALGLTVFAKQASEQAEIFYNNIKIYINGAEIVPKDANGNTVEPFTMNGTTYLPVRAISNAFGQDVEWDGATQSVYIGKKDQTKPDNYLDRIQYNDLIIGDNDNSVSRISGTVTDYLNTDYKSGLVFKQVSYFAKVIENDKDNAGIIIDYPLNSQYKKFTGTVVLPDKIDIAGFEKKENANPEDQKVDVFIYGDGKLLKKLTVSKTMPMKIDLDVSGVNMLEIKTRHEMAQYIYTYTALTDLALFK